MSEKIRGVIKKIWLNEREMKDRASGGLKMMICPNLVFEDGTKVSLPPRDNSKIFIEDKDGKKHVLKETDEIIIKAEENKGYLNGKVTNKKVACLIKSGAGSVPADNRNSSKNNYKSNYDPKGAMIGGCKHDAATILASMISQGTEYSKSKFEEILTDIVNAEVNDDVKEPEKKAEVKEVKKKAKPPAKKKEVEADSESTPFDLDMDSDSGGIDPDDLLG